MVFDILEEPHGKGRFARIDLRKLRHAAGISQTVAADRLGLSLRQYQRCEAEGITTLTIAKLAEFVLV